MTQRPQDRFRAVVTTDQGRCRVAVAGVIDENADLAPLQAAAGAGAVEVDFSGVRRINSYGVRAWMNAMRELQQPGVRVSFVRCPAHVIDQVNMVHGFLGAAHVESLIAPRLCEDCDEHADQLIELAELRGRGGKLPDLACPRCGHPMDLDDVAHKYELLLTLLPE
ncbi:MAG TPA: STAS domain-containing protein [Kofleriaceae bacterium]|jgi:anti-anti-sigma regulatory factor|nr:STAS domain-containing protein [Kofleriaceae bacterium]